VIREDSGLSLPMQVAVEWLLSTRNRDSRSRDRLEALQLSFLFITASDGYWL